MTDLLARSAPPPDVPTLPAMPIVTSTYRSDRPPRKRRPGIEAPAIVTIDPKTLLAKKRAAASVGGETAAQGEVLARAAEVGAVAQSSITQERRRYPSITMAEKAPPASNDDAPRKSAIIVFVIPRRAAARLDS